MKGIVAIGIIATVLAHGAAATPQGLKPPRPKTLLTVSGSIAGFAQDGDHVVWGNGYAQCGRIVQLRTLSTGATRFLDTPKGPMCEATEYGGMQRDMALAGTRALWAYVSGSLSNNYFQLFTAAPGDRAEHRLDAWEQEGGLADIDAFRPVRMAGDGTTLVYLGSGVQRVVGQRAQRVAGTEGALAVDFAVLGSRLALARWIPPGGRYSESPVWSPDGRRIAFRSYRAGFTRWQLFVMNADGSDPRLLMGNVYFFAYAPNGAAIAALQESNLVVIAPNGSQRRIVARGVQDGYSEFAWSPDGRLLAYRRVVGGQPRLFVVPASGGAAVDLGVASYEPFAWSPDARLLAYTGYVGKQPHLYVVGASGGAAVDLGVASDGRELIAWSPDARFLAYTRSVGEQPHLYVAPASGEPAVDLGLGESPSWSPDGSAIAFVREDGAYVIASDGSDLRRIAATGGSEKIPGSLHWSPDGRWIAFADETGLRIVPPAGGPPREVSLQETGPASLQWSPNSRAIAVRTDNPDFDYSIAIVDVESGGVRSIGPGASPSWSPGGERLLYSAHLPTGLEPPAGPRWNAAIAVVDTAGGKPTLLTRTEPTASRMVVETRSRDGKLQSSFDGPLQLAGLAFSGSRFALVVGRSTTRQGPRERSTIEIRNAAGKLLRRVSVPRPAWNRLSMSGRWVVFRTGAVGGGRDRANVIRLLDAETGRMAILARAQGVVLGLSIDGRRVAWAEQNRVRAVMLPRS